MVDIHRYILVQRCQYHDCKLLQLLQKRIESWFSGQSNKTYFHLDSSLGTVLAYPEEYFSIEQMNDHHFHYGYWIRVMAEIALRDPAWAAKERWGGMVDLLVADIAHISNGLLEQRAASEQIGAAVEQTARTTDTHGQSIADLAGTTRQLDAAVQQLVSAVEHFRT